MRIIKRYQNRKLYDTETSRYITLDELAHLISEGVEFKVVENKTGEDITSTVLTQIIYESEKKKKKILPIDFLKKIIQYGEESLNDMLEKLSLIEKANLREAEKRIRELVKKSEPRADGGKTKFKEILTTAQTGVQEIEKKVDEALQEAINRIPGLGTVVKELRQIRSELDELKKDVNKLKKRSSRS